MTAGAGLPALPPCLRRALAAALRDRRGDGDTLLDLHEADPDGEVPLDVDAVVDGPVVAIFGADTVAPGLVPEGEPLELALEPLLRALGLAPANAVRPAPPLPPFAPAPAGRQLSLF